MNDFIKLFQTERSWAQIRDEVFESVDYYHRLGVAQNGAPARELETILESVFARRYAVTVANCTDALTLALKALKLPGNAQIAVSNYTFTATAHAIARAGYSVVPVDVKEDYTIDISQIPANVDAVVAVDLFGNMSDWQSLMKLGVPIINDAAQSFESADGAKMSPEYGHVACLSFSPSKTISSWGSGGAIVTDDPAIAEYVRLARLHGKRQNFDLAIDPGLNSMMSTFECASVITTIKNHMLSWFDRRTEISEFILSNSQFETGIEYLPKHTYHKLVFQADNRSEVSTMLSNKKIDCAIHYHRTINDEPLYRTNREFPVSDRLKQTSFTIPNQHTLTDQEVEHIARALK